MTPVEGGLKAADLAVERRALVAALKAVGPDAPTLAGAWTARDLAAHVAATEQSRGVPTFLGRTLVVRYGLRLNDTFRPIMAIDLRRLRRHGFDWALRRLERQPPGLPSRASVLPVSVFEIFVHHEDVRRPNDVAREAPIPDLAPCIEWLLRYHRRPLGHFGVRVVLPDGRELRGGGPGSALTIRGSADEIVLWLAGRPQAPSLVRLGTGATWDSWDDESGERSRLFQLFDADELVGAMEDAGFDATDRWIEESTWGRPANPVRPEKRRRRGSAGSGTTVRHRQVCRRSPQPVRSPGRW